MMTAVLLDAVRGAFEVAAHAAAHDLRIDRCHQLGGIDQVDERTAASFRSTSPV